MQENSEMVAIDVTSGLSSRDQRAISRNIKRGHDSPSTIVTGITTRPRKRRGEAFDERWMRRMKRDIAQFLAEAADEERGCPGLMPDRVLPDTPYQEKPFGQFFPRDDGDWGPFAAGDAAPRLPDSVVSLALFDDGDVMLFACSGVALPEEPGAAGRHLTRFLTSARLVTEFNHKRNKHDKLRIEVFLPPNQRTDGTLELYHSNYNIAIISVEKHFVAARPENIFSRSAQKLPKKVVAVGREAPEGLLLASMGHVMDMPRWVDTELDCKDLKISTCKIKKVGIGGPLVTSHDGSFVGMNFYDDTCTTPFLPRSKIVDVLKGTDLPSERGLNCPVNMMDDTMTIEKNRWPVPEAYWYHPMFDEDLGPFRPHVGRVLQ